MMNGHRAPIQAPANHSNSFNIPLLDDEFDPDEEAIFEHSELAPLHTVHLHTDDFSM